MEITNEKQSILYIKQCIANEMESSQKKTLHQKEYTLSLECVKKKAKSWNEIE